MVEKNLCLLGVREILEYDFGGKYFSEKSIAGNHNL